MTMEEALEQLQAGDTKERLAGVERLQRFLDQSKKSLSEKEVTNLVDASTVLLKDNNFKVCHGTLNLLILAAAMSGEYLKVHINQLVPAVVERLGDSKQIVRDAGRRFLLVLMEVSTPSSVADRAGSYAWTHKNWRVREEFARTVASAFNLFSATDFHFQRLHLPAVLQLLEDSNSNVREAAMLCLEEMYRHGGQNVKGELQRHHVRPAQMKEISSRFERIEPVKESVIDPSITNGSSRSSQRNFCHALSIQHGVSNGPASPSQHSNLELKAAHSGGHQRRLSPHRRCSPTSRPMVPFDSHNGGGGEGHEKSVDPIKVFSERELTKEFEKIASLLKAEQDWSVRMAAMQKLEGIIVGGAVECPCFLTLFRHFVGPLSSQLSDRRSSIVKQACQLLKILSKRLETGFESFAEAFIPVLFKSVVITVLVIAESADNCIKTMLRNCRVARALPRILECAKHDRNATLRSRCCEYALLVLERWGDSPELHRAPDLYQELIRCCSLDAVGEVRSSARACYRVYKRLWPDRARRVYSLLDPAVQKALHDEETVHTRYMSPPVRNEGDSQNHRLRQSLGMLVHSGQDFGQETSYERSKNMASSAEFANSSNTLQRKSFDTPHEKNNLQTMLQASHLKAMEIMLKGVDTSESVICAPDRLVGGSYREIHAPASAGTMRVTVDSPSARDPPHPASAPAICHHDLQQTNVQHYEHNNITSPSATIQAYSGVETSKEEENEEAIPSETNDVSPSASTGGISVGFQGPRRVLPGTDMSLESSLSKEIILDKGVKRNSIPDSHKEKLRIPDSLSSTGALSLRMNLKHTGSGRSSESSSLEENHQQGVLNPQGEISSYMDGVMTLNDVLSEGLGTHADWSARVAAFTYIQRLLQQGSKGLHEVTQNFERIMKLFSGHLDDPHWKVTQAALSALIELVPTCRRMFESYLERTLPSVFARLVDSKEAIRRLGSSALATIGDTYSIDTLLLPLLRSLDEQRIPKARMAVIEFAISALAKLAMDSSGTGSTGLLRLWLGKLAPLANDKNAKLREAAIAGIIFVYSQFDPTIVLNFILGLSIEDQSMLRRALKQFTPRIDLDLMAYLQNKIQRPKPIKSVPDQTDYTLGRAEDLTNRAFDCNDSEITGYSTNLSALEGGCKRTSSQTDRTLMHCLGHQASSLNDLKHLAPPQDSQGAEDAIVTFERNKTKELCNGVCGSHDSSTIQSFQAQFKDYHISNGNFSNKVSNTFNLQSLRASMARNLDLKRSSEIPLEGHKTYTEAYLQKSPDHELSQALQRTSDDHDNYHQSQESLGDHGGYQRISYSNLYSRSPTK
ncbi:hypothetical protein M758_4G252000 [Ceratodon purpureus]|nr:hypothetical protein M758_4G252000 [Ceratodon purpureus]